MPYRDWIKKSLKATIAAKWLWVPAAVGTNVSYRAFTNTFDKRPKNNDSSAINGIAHVLGASVNPFIESLKSVPASHWILLVLAIVLLVIFGIALRMVLSAWRSAAIISGLQNLHTNKLVTLSSMSLVAVPKIRSIVKYYIYTGVVTVILVFVLALLGSRLFIAMNSQMGSFARVTSGFGIGALMMIVLLLLIALGVAHSYALRYIVLKKLMPVDALLQSLSLFKSHPGPTLVVLAINFLAILAGGIAILLLAFLGGALAGLVLLFAAMLIVIFQESMWNLLFDKITQK